MKKLIIQKFMNMLVSHKALKSASRMLINNKKTPIKGVVFIIWYPQANSNRCLHRESLCKPYLWDLTDLLYFENA